ncbi:MAG: Hemolysin-type calcium-binding region [Caulobacter sp.]|nr:Hemolysin-type calcium-binding region [Caulobacter sp.]
MTTVTAGANVALQMNLLDINGILDGVVTSATTSRIELGYAGSDERDVFFGTFVLNSDPSKITGTITGLEYYRGGALVFKASDFSVSVADYLGWAQNADPAVGLDLAFRGILGGADIFIGSPLDDTLYGYPGDDVMDGGAGADILRGNAGADTLRGGDGDDYLHGGAGDDLLDGGAGIDRVAFSTDISVGAVGVVVDLTKQGVAQDTGHGRDTLVNIENLSGTIYDDTLIGDDRGNWLWGGSNGTGVTGNDTISGGGGDDLIEVGAGDHTLSGGAGVDTASLRGNTTDISAQGATVSLALQGARQDTGQGAMRLDGFENLSGSVHGDQLTGDAGANVLAGAGGDDILRGGGGDDTLLGDGAIRPDSGPRGLSGRIVTLENDAQGKDTLEGGAGDDLLVGGAGNDKLDGGAGTDKAKYLGASVDFSWTLQANGDYVVVDLRGGSPEGTDTLTGVERLVFTDKEVGLSASPAAAAVVVAESNILRGASSPAADAILAKVESGVLTQAQATAELVKLADATTSVATLSYQFFTGKVPSQGGIDYLVSPTGPNANNLNSAYYQSFNLENRYINFAVNLGKVGEGQTKFQAEYGALSLFDATKKAYGVIFGATPTDAKVAALLSGGRDAYFDAYGQDGLNGLGTKAAMVGWLLGEAEKADLGSYAKANAAFLTDLADGASFAVDLVGTYAKPEFAYGG